MSLDNCDRKIKHEQIFTIKQMRFMVKIRSCALRYKYLLIGNHTGFIRRIIKYNIILKMQESTEI